MIENIPHSVLFAIKAAARDVANSVKGGAYNPIQTETLANTLEKFMVSMVSPSYPKVKSSWIDCDIDGRWVKSAAVEGLVDDEQLLKAMEKWKPMFSPDNYDMLVRNNFSKFHGKSIEVLQKEDPQLYKEYSGAIAPTPTEGVTALPEAPKPTTAPNTPPLPSKKKDEDIAPPKQELMKPGQVKPLPEDDQFEKGKPVAPYL